MIIVDVESSGIDTRLCSLLSIGAVDFDNPKNQFYVECRIFDGAHCEKEASEIHKFTDAQMKDVAKKTDREAVEAFLEWMKTCKEWTLAGQNVSFDRDFLMEAAHRYHIDWPLAQRTVDLHSLAFYHMTKRGVELPKKNNHSALNLDAILQYVGVGVLREDGHNALEDAKLETEAFSRFLTGKSLFEEYSLFPIPVDLRS